MDKELTEAKQELPTTGAISAPFTGLMSAFMAYAILQGFHDIASKDGREAGTRYLIDKMVDWLTHQGYTYWQVEKFIEDLGGDVENYISSTISLEDPKDLI